MRSSEEHRGAKRQPGLRRSPFQNSAAVSKDPIAPFFALSLAPSQLSLTVSGDVFTDLELNISEQRPAFTIPGSSLFGTYDGQCICIILKGNIQGVTQNNSLFSYALVRAYLKIAQGAA